jgi:hypothetical protein
MLELLKHKSTKDLGNIQQIEDTLKRLKKDDKKDINADTRQRSTSNMLLELLHYKDQSIRLRTVIDNESTMKNFVDNPALLMDIPIESSQDAVFVENVYSKIRVERLLINNHTASAALQAITDRNGQTLHDYLMHSISHGTNEKFMPSIELESQFIEVKKTYPEIVKFL